MGALTTNRKRRDEYYTLDSKLPSSYCTPNDDKPIDLHVSKKPRIQSPSYSITETRFSSKSAETRVSGVFRYPEPVNPIRREVHAPCRVPKLGFLMGSNRNSNSRPSREGFVGVIGSVPRFGFNWVTNRAVEAMGYFRKDKGVVGIDVDVESYGDDALEDSSIKKDEWAKDCGMESFVYRKKMHFDEEGYVNDALKGSGIGKVGWVKNNAEESFGYRKMDREVIDVEEEKCRSNVSTGSSIEEVEFMEDDVLPSSQELDGKAMERNSRPSSSSVVSELTKVGNIAAISLEQKVEKLERQGMPMYKKLHQNAERRKSKLDSLNFEIELNEARRATFQLLRPVKRVEEEVKFHYNFHCWECHIILLLVYICLYFMPC